MSFQFASPWLLSLLVFVPLLAYLLNRKQGRHQTAGLRFASLGLVRYTHLAFGATPPVKPHATAGYGPDHHWYGEDWETVNFMAFDPASYTQVTSFVFSQSNPDSLNNLAGGGHVFISSVIAEKHGLALGDRLLIKTRFGEIPFTVAAITVDFSNQGLVINGSWRIMEHYFRLRGANALLVKVTPGATPDGVGDEIDARYGERERLVIISNETLLGRITNLMQQAFRMFDVLALIAMLVGFMGIANTLTMNVMERVQEIGMLRAVGMTHGQVVADFCSRNL